jgi:hypothetical protein
MTDNVAPDVPTADAQPEALVFTRRHLSGYRTTEWTVDEIGVWTDNFFTPWHAVVELTILPSS